MLSERDFKKLRDVIYGRTGIAIEDKKYNILSKKIEDLIKKHGYEDFRSFFHIIRFDKDKALFQELINTVTVNETYFFRENYQFESLINHVLPKLHKLRPKDEVIRILCAPSSTGEEPYSIALHLLDEGKLVEERDFEIIGIDIDSNVLQKAERGLFTKRSVQFLPQHILKEYFKPVGINYEIAEFLREAITFKKVNVMDKLEIKRLGKFDVIFFKKYTYIF